MRKQTTQRRRPKPPEDDDVNIEDVLPGKVYFVGVPDKSQRRNACLLEVEALHYPEGWDVATEAERAKLLDDVEVEGTWLYEWDETPICVRFVDRGKLKEEKKHRDDGDERKFVAPPIKLERSQVFWATNTYKKWAKRVPFNSLLREAKVAYGCLPAERPEGFEFCCTQSFDEAHMTFARFRDHKDRPQPSTTPAMATFEEMTRLPEDDTKPTALIPLVPHLTAKGAVAEADALKGAGGHRAPHPSLRERRPNDILVIHPCSGAGAAVFNLSGADIDQAAAHVQKKEHARKRRQKANADAGGAGSSGSDTAGETSAAEASSRGSGNNGGGGDGGSGGGGGGRGDGVGAAAATTSSPLPYPAGRGCRTSDAGGTAAAGGSGEAGWCGSGGAAQDPQYAGREAAAAAVREQKPAAEGLRVRDFWALDVSRDALTTFLANQGDEVVAHCMSVAEFFAFTVLLNSLASRWKKPEAGRGDGRSGGSSGGVGGRKSGNAVEGLAPAAAAGRRGDSGARAGRGSGTGVRSRSSSGSGSATSDGSESESDKDESWEVADIVAVRMCHCAEVKGGQLVHGLKLEQCWLEFYVDWLYDSVKHKKIWASYPEGRYQWVSLKHLNCHDLLRAFVHRVLETEALLPMPGQRLALVAGTPCQDMCGYNLERLKQPIMSSPKNRVILEVEALARYLQVDYLLLEQVTDAADCEDGIWFRTLLALLVQDNRQVRVAVIHAASHGSPQVRPRMFIWAARRDRPLPPFPRPEFHPKLSLPAGEGEEVVVQKLRKFRNALKGCYPVPGEGKLLYPPQTITDAISNLERRTNFSMSPVTHLGAAAHPLQALLARPPPDGTPSAEVRFAQYLGNCAPAVLALPRVILRLFKHHLHDQRRKVLRRAHEKARRAQKKAEAAAAAGGSGGGTAAVRAEAAGGRCAGTGRDAAAAAEIPSPRELNILAADAAWVRVGKALSELGKGPQEAKGGAKRPKPECNRVPSREQLKRAGQELVGAAHAALIRSLEHAPRLLRVLQDEMARVEAIGTGDGAQAALATAAPVAPAPAAAAAARLQGAGDREQPAQPASNAGACGNVPESAASRHQEPGAGGSGVGVGVEARGLAAAASRPGARVRGASQGAKDGGPQAPLNDQEDAGQEVEDEAGKGAPEAVRSAGSAIVPQRPVLVANHVPYMQYLPIWMRILEAPSGALNTWLPDTGDGNGTAAGGSRAASEDRPAKRLKTSDGSKAAAPADAKPLASKPFRRLHPQQAEGTVCGPSRSTHPEKCTCLHPVQDRGKTPREDASFQGVPHHRTYLTTVSCFMEPLRRHRGLVSRTEAVLKPAIRGLEWLLHVVPAAVAYQDAGDGDGGRDGGGVEDDLQRQLTRAARMLRRVVSEEHQQIGNGWAPPVAEAMGRCLALALCGWPGDKPLANVPCPAMQAAWDSCTEAGIPCVQAMLWKDRGHMWPAEAGCSAEEEAEQEFGEDDDDQEEEEEGDDEVEEEVEQEEEKQAGPW